MKHTCIFALLILLLSSACTMAEKGTDPVPAGAVEYTLTFKATWSAQTHPTDFPSNPHFSPLVGTTHNDKVRFWNTGEKASPGIKSMAETGNPTLLAGEIGTAYAGKNSRKATIREGSFPSPSSVSVKFITTEDFPLLTMVAMLAPSPDWFMGVHDRNLMKDGNWIESETFDVHIYDAGTDDGLTFTSADADSNPKRNIERLSEGSFTGDGKTVVGTFTLKKS